MSRQAPYMGGKQNIFRLEWPTVNQSFICIYMVLFVAVGSKGQLISKCLFGAIVSTKKPTNIFLRISALASKKRSNQKNKGTLSY